MQVTLYLDTEQDLYHTSYVYSALFGLAARREIELELRTPPIDTWRKLNPGSVCVFVDFSAPDGAIIPVAIDLRDRSDIFDERALDSVAVYFKRSYYLPDVTKLLAEVREKVIPFGMNFVCANVPSAKAVSEQILRRIASKIAGRRNGAGTVRSLLRKLSDYWRYRRESDYLAGPETPKTAAVIFQTRIWEDHEARGDDADSINEQRVHLVRALKQGLRGRFCGGLIPTPLALRRHPDLVTDQGVSPVAFTHWQRGLLIGVYSRGLHHSTAWKLGEYFASSMCVVAEPPRNQLPVPLSDGKELLTFASPEDCIAECDAILASPDLQRRMRAAAHDYYRREVAPEAHLRSCLARAAAHHESYARSPED